jgi:hypothetical protein
MISFKYEKVSGHAQNIFMSGTLAWQCQNSIFYWGDKNFLCPKKRLPVQRREIETERLKKMKFFKNFNWLYLLGDEI